MVDMTDEQIAEEIVNGNNELFGELVRRYEQRLVRYTTYILQDKSAAYDVVQDTFIKSFENLKSFNTERKFSSWIYRIAHNESINRIKKNGREIFNVDFDFLKELMPPDTAPDVEFERNEINESLRKSMEMLPVKFREVLTLYYLENKSYDEISDILRISIGTVGTWINRGKAKLKKILQELY
jgi:RNA polymerase sigma-70 factor (ECF subfamily)